MAEESDKLNLTSKQKTQLLSLGLDGSLSEQEPDEQRADMLYDILKRPLPPDTSAYKSLPIPLKTVSLQMRSVAGKPLKELLLDPKTEIRTLERIKEYAKQSGKSAKSESETDVFLAVYYASIANGLVFHDTKISEHSDNHLRQAFELLTQKRWLPEQLTELLKRACERSFGKSQ